MKVFFGRLKMKKILFILFCFFTTVQASKNQILIYNGPGTGKESLKQTLDSLKSSLASFYEVKEISPEEIIDGNWQQNAALLVIPGGADLPYCKTLNGLGNRKIISYVEEGGAFLAICAGGYYGGSFIEFSKSTPIEVKGPRELCFFPGVVRGPLFPYDYKSSSGARAIKIKWMEEDILKDKEFRVYYNGGGYFVDADKFQNVKVLAMYNDEKFPAIVECSVKKGKAILSGTHFEYNSFLIKDNEYYKNIISDLQDGEKNRVVLLKAILQRLDLKTK